MVTQFSSVCLTRRREDNKFLEYNTDFKKGHLKEKCVLSAVEVLAYWNKSIPKTAKTKQILSCDLKRHFSFLMYMHNIYTLFGVSLMVEIVKLIMAVRFWFFWCIKAVEQMFGTVWNIPSSPSHHPFTLSHLEGTMSRMSSHHANNKINALASFVDTLNWSLFIQQKATMWVAVTACVVTLSMWIWKKDRRENVIYREQLINLMVVSLAFHPQRRKSTFFSCSACYIDVTSHLFP